MPPAQKSIATIEDFVLKDIRMFMLLLACSNASPHVRTQAVAAFAKLVQTQGVRDAEFTANTYFLLFEAMLLCWGQALETAAVLQLQAAFAALIRMNWPEFSAETAAAHVDSVLIRCVLDRFEAGIADERAFLRDLAHWLYANFPHQRVAMRARIGAVLSHYSRQPNKRTHVKELLEVVGQIVIGFQRPLTAVHKGLLLRVLLSLHAPNEMHEWRDQIPVLQLYHEPLVYAIVQFLEHDPSLTVTVLDGVLAAWPEGFQSNTPKEVLLLHEVETLLRRATAADFAAVLPRLLPKLVHCLSLENSRVVERALFMWKDEAFLALVRGQTARIVQPVMTALLRGGESFWNPTVNKMAAHVLEQLEQMDATAFAAAANALWSSRARPPRVQPDALISAVAARKQSSLSAQRSSSSSSSSSAAAAVPAQQRQLTAPQTMMESSMTTLRGGMAGWKPTDRGGRGAPPLTVTGVAPWAFQQPAVPSKSSSHTGSSTAEPMAPPAKRPLPCDSQPDAAATATATSSGTNGATAAVPGITAAAAAAAAASSIAESSSSSSTSNTGLARVHAFMLHLRPEGAGTGGPAPTASWHDAQLDPTPTLLPSLKFHDLVFGRELGKGTFSTVRYARRIVAGSPRSEWPEYAVKTIDPESLAKHRYSGAARNEVAVLRLLSHPGIARMVSAFRWRGGVYLVLEYAPRGDLHTHIVANGSLDEESARFVTAEVTAALCAVHDAGFVYGDLKPENVVITEAGHVKLADFGACRPYTAEARQLLARSRNALKELRDGDWRAAAGLPPVADALSSSTHMDTDSSTTAASDDDDAAAAAADAEESEERVEGTLAYLDPEVIAGQRRPDLLSDAWALGCLLYHCLAGRAPAVPASAADAMAAAVVRFADTAAAAAADSAATSTTTATTAGDDSSATELQLPAGASPAAVVLVRSLRAADPGARLTVGTAAQHEFFTAAGVDVYSCYKGPAVQLQRGTVAPAPAAAAWTRRNNSMIWAPMPAEYSLQTPAQHALSAVPETAVEAAAGVWYESQLGRIAEGLPSGAAK
jgi:serine/threonine protein kinase